MLARDVMSHSVWTVGPEMTAPQLARFLSDKMISGAPVVDAEGRLVGVVSHSDLVLKAAQDTVRPRPLRGVGDFYRDLWAEEAGELLALPESVKVEDLMSPNPIFVLEHTPINEVVDVMLINRIHRVIVMRNQAVVGIITSIDLMAYLAHAASPMAR